MHYDSSSTNQGQQGIKDDMTYQYSNTPAQKIVYQHNPIVVRKIQSNETQTSDFDTFEIIELSPQDEAKFYQSVRKPRHI